MATVYLATDLKHDRKVAVKVLRPEIAAALGAERFLAEIRVTASLQHPHILPLFDSGEADGLLYYVMPHVTGETLAERMGGDGPLPVGRAVEITSSIASALDYAHRQGVIHRDIKPANILIQDGQALLADFGIALARKPDVVERITTVGVTLGTVQYMSPEQCLGEDVTAASDQYSLACVTYEMLTGAPPFAGRTPQGVMARHTVDPAPDARLVRPDLPPGLEATLRRGMSKSPADRYPSAGAFAEALRDPRGESFPARSRRRALPAVAATAALVVAVAWSFTRGGDPQLDANRILVYPLVLPAGFQGPATLGEDVATMIGHALDGTGPLRWLDGWTLLDPATRDDIRSLSLDRARELARSRGSGFFVTGRLVERGDSTDVYLDLHTTDGDDVVARGQASGRMDDAWRPGLTAVNALLPTLIPGGASDVSADWRDRHPTAIANFLLAESAFRRVHLEEALAGYRDAVAVDSTFAVAAIRGAQAASWNHRPDEARSLVSVALSQPLAPRYRHFALGYRHYLQGHADSAEAELRLAVEADPDMVGAWMQLGEVFTHLLPLTGTPDSLADAAFARARLLDPSAANILLHPVEIRLRRGDFEAAAPLMRQFMAGEPSAVEAAKLDIMRRCVEAGVGGVDWHAEAATRPLPLLFAASALGGNSAPSGCPEAAFDALLQMDTALTEEADGRRQAAFIGRFSIAAGRGDADGAMAIVDTMLERWGYGSTLFLWAAPLAPPLLERARGVAQGDEEEWGPNYEACPYPRRLWQLGVLEATTGRLEVAAAVAAELAVRGREPEARYERGLARSLDGFVAMARGDTARAITIFTELVPDALVAGDLKWDEAEPRGAERLALARLHLARGEAQLALEVATVFDSSWPVAHFLYLPASLELRARAAEMLDDPVGAAGFRERLAALLDRGPDAAQ